MTASIIIQILSIVMLMLLAVPGTQWIWKFSNKEIVKNKMTFGVRESMILRLFNVLSKTAAAIF